MALVFQYRLASHVPGSTTTTGNAFRGAGSFSPTGRYVLFDSSASNLAGSDSNAGSDLFLYDTQDFSVDLVSHVPGRRQPRRMRPLRRTVQSSRQMAVMCSSTAVPRILPAATATLAAICSSTTRRARANEAVAPELRRERCPRSRAGAK